MDGPGLKRMFKCDKVDGPQGMIVEGPNRLNVDGPGKFLGGQK